MTKILHIIGTYGVGKSTLAQRISDSYRSHGVPCDNLLNLCLHEPGAKTDLTPYRDPNSNHVYIVEHLETPDPEHLVKGDLIIRMERVQ